MQSFSTGDIVARKSYGGDTLFKIHNSNTRKDGKTIYTLKGLLYRIEADAEEDDLIPQDRQQAYKLLQRSLTELSPAGQSYSGGYYQRRSRVFVPYILQKRLRPQKMPGLILHIDSSEDYLDMCMKYYRQSNLKAIGKVIEESQQPRYIKSLLASTRADIIIITGHDGIKKNASKVDNVNNYRNSKYYIQATKEARSYQPDFDKLCIFSGACQSYFEGLMAAGANFASSPGRVFIHALDPGKVGKLVARTESSRVVTAEQIADITQSGMKGIGGINTKGHLK